MQDWVYQFHTGWRWIALLLLAAALVMGLAGRLRRRGWGQGSRRIARFATIAFDIEVTAGLILYVLGRWWASGNAFRAYVHPALMFAALAAIHVASARAKRTSDPLGKHQWTAIGAGLALVIALAGGGLPELIGDPMGR